MWLRLPKIEAKVLSVLSGVFCLSADVGGNSSATPIVINLDDDDESPTPSVAAPAPAVATAAAAFASVAALAAGTRTSMKVDSAPEPAAASGAHSRNQSHKRTLEGDDNTPSAHSSVSSSSSAPHSSFQQPVFGMCEKVLISPLVSIDI